MVTISSSSVIVAIFQAFIGLKLQARIDRELKEQESQLKIGQKDIELRFGVLTQRQADVLSSIYSCLYDVSQALKAFSFTVQSETEGLVADKEEELQRLNQKFQDVFGRNQIFLPAVLAEKLEASTIALTRLISKNGRSSYIPESAGAEEIGVMANQIKHLHIELKENLKALANEMRALLGAGR